MEASVRRAGWIAGALATAAVVLGGLGCATEEPENGALQAELTRRTLQRVVIARMYQRDHWVVPGVDPAVDRAAAAQHVCDAIAPLRPTYVSGLVRLDHADTIREEQVDMFRRVRRCIRERVPHPVRFDVVLNALDYTDGTPEDGSCDPPSPARMSAEELTERLRRRRRSIEERLAPDGYFFDFFSQPWVRDDRDGGPWRPRVLEDEMRRMQRDGLFVGGNVWGGHVPPGASYVAITDRAGRERVIEQAERLRAQGVPVLLHIRNDPHIEGSGGRLWNERDRAYRKQQLRRHVRWAEESRATYMYPVFFPLAPHPAPTGRGCDRERWIAYDASADGNMLDRMRDYMGGGDRAARLMSRAGEDALPSAIDEDDDGMRVVHRAVHAGAAQHLYSGSLLEIEDAAALTTEVESYFALARSAAPGTAPLYRCDLGHGDHLLTRDAACEGAPGARAEGSLGLAATSPIAGTVPLFRLYREGSSSASSDHFYTTSAIERDGAAAYGYVSEGIVGHVWDASGLAVADEGAPVAPPEPATTPVRITVHRGVHGATGQHLFSTSLDEILDAPGVTREASVFLLVPAGTAGTLPLHRCYLGGGWHLLTTSETCEGAPGAVREGALGNLSPTPAPGTIPLFRLFKPGTRQDHFYTIDPSERAIAIALGYRDEGIAGYAFTPP